ncbi:MULTISPECIES: class I SAM-dependent methyltransferase [unclassified Vibrio]|uniref:class I SAM-dependent methyltransferase n=1 Tax=unclassified Vibrio TaxID=2614977 RepID=UPI00354D9742
MKNQHLTIMKHYEKCLDLYGDTHLGVDWPNKEDAKLRYSVMKDLIVQEDLNSRISLLDFGCGASHFFEYLKDIELNNVDYSGLDISRKFVTLSKDKFPGNNYYCVDILRNDTDLPQFDYAILNGVFTEKCDLSFEEMFSFFQAVLTRVFKKVNTGMAFNVMSKNVDWERDDLFHLSLDLLTEFLSKNISRKYIIRNDYGLYEYTVYVYK